jgi:hypothetical protein
MEKTKKALNNTKNRPRFNTKNRPRFDPVFVYVDWAWGYTCDASEEEAFASMLRTKLQTIAENAKKG